MSKKIKVTQIKSTIGKLQNQKLTMRALGIKKLHQSVVHADTPAVRGMVNCVKHLLKIEEVDGD
jgi:large subunit ribosomal protein L30